MIKSKDYFLKKAEENLPKLYHSQIFPEIKTIDVKKGDSFVLDLGQHCVGYFSFKFDNIDNFTDAPTRLIIKFGEDKKEIESDFASYQGTLSKTWLQEEVLNLDYPQSVSMPRRYSCRYIKITVDDTRKPITLYDFCFDACTSANKKNLKAVCISDPLIEKIDKVSVNTLKDCMQTFFEDGPKRDRRLWIGDLRLEALANYYTFNNLEIVKRCLYLFAAAESNNLGFISSFIYETPYYFSGRSYLADYALLYVVSVCDYYEHTKDTDTVNDLLDICKSQINSLKAILDSNLIVTKQKGWFTFIDWCPGLNGLISLQGIFLYTLEKFIALLKAINDTDFAKYENLLIKVRAASKQHLFNKEKGVFVSSIDDEQLSVHSQVWMILGGVIDGDTAKNALLSTLSNVSAKQPFTPYMRHYVIEAMLKLDLLDEAVKLMKSIWGGMVELGADTFWEVYSPDDLDFSPYGSRMINSLCHAWSCTPTYFIRKYGL